jgi:DivIVA domain-containing protein
MSDAGLTADDVRSATFNKPPLGKRGYDEDEGDEFLDTLAATIARPDDRP